MDRVRFKGAAHLRLYEEIIKHWRKAAESGYAKAQFELGASYASGEGVKQDDLRALMWLNLAAAQGNENASRLRVKLKQRMTESQIERAYGLEREWRCAHPKKPRSATVAETIAHPSHVVKPHGLRSLASEAGAANNTGQAAGHRTTSSAIGNVQSP